jgi:hypothetical protein
MEGAAVHPIWNSNAAPRNVAADARMATTKV